MVFCLSKQRIGSALTTIHKLFAGETSAETKDLLCGDPSSFSQRLLTVDVNWVDTDEPETHANTH